MSELGLVGVSKKLGDHQAVDDVSFTVNTGEFFVLLGSSGSGKTTMLRLICGLEQPDGGQIILDGRDICGLPPRERNLGMVFQEYGLYPAMDVRGNIAYGLEARGKVSKDEIARRVQEAADKLGLSEMLNRSTQEMSGGEQQRVALARAMVKDASAYLFDEPLSNLDPKLRNRARRDILTVHRAKQQPSVYVTHDQSEAFAMADRVGIMSHGRLEQVGTPDELLERPANVFVARFVGSPPMNVIAMPEHWAGLAPGGSTAGVLAGFRPEAIRYVGEAAHRDGLQPLQGTIVDAEPGLTELIVRFTVAGGASSNGSGGDTTVTAVFEDDLDVNPGDVVSFGIDAERIHLFDGRTEQALAAPRV